MGLFDNPRSDAAGDVDAQIKSLLFGPLSRQYGVQPYSLERLNAMLRGDRMRALGQAGSLATSRGYSLGLNNPFKMAQRAEAGVYDQYAGRFGQNVDRAFGQQLSRFQGLADLMRTRAGNLGNMSSGFFNEIGGPLLGSLIGAGGNIYGGYLSSGRG